MPNSTMDRLKGAVAGPLQRRLGGGSRDIGGVLLEIGPDLANGVKAALEIYLECPR